jgi:C-terminal processing protease CtpA/Prc
MSVGPEIELPPGRTVSTAPLLEEVRPQIGKDAFTLSDREFVLRQAAAVIDDVYVHLWQKRAMYGIEPSQRLRLLRRRLAQLTDVQFHAGLQRIFDDLRDLHTQYVLPRQYQGLLASLGLLIEQYWEGDEPHWLASHVRADMVGDSALVPGVEITHWNGSPIAVAVARHAEDEAGSNPAARLARGLERMTQRPLALSQLPDEDWVDLRYRVNGATHETRIPWRVVGVADMLNKVDDDEAGMLPGVASPPSHLLALDLRTEVVRKVKKAMFAPAGAAATGADEASTDIATTRPPGELKARTVTTSQGTFGHLRIYTFLMSDANFLDFLAEVRRILPLMPRDGLILDVRGNGGGYAYAAEALLQCFTPRPVQPAPFQLISTESTADLCRKVPSFANWSASIDESVETGAQYSRAVPLFPPPLVNDRGQVYHGPVVLVTDGLCYSATDIFAAGFQDHKIGKVLGVDDNTGAGGANVFELSDFLLAWPGCPFEPLPGGARMRVAIRRSLRVGEQSGQPLEDLGVIPDVRHRLTRRDLLAGNADLIEKAARILAGQKPRRLDVNLTARADGTEFILTTAKLTSVDIYVDGRPVRTTPVVDGENTFAIPAVVPTSATVRIEGFDGKALVAARTVAPTQ